MEIAIFVFVHAMLSVFTQTFFLHRYGAHRMLKMSRGRYSGLGPMRMDPKDRYHDLAWGLVAPEPRFDGGYPEWKALDRRVQS